MNDPTGARLPLAGRAWGRVFVLGIATPALALSWLGLRAVGADAIEREQRVRDRQTQLAGLAAAAIATLLASLEADRRQPEDAWSSQAGARTAGRDPLSPVLFDSAGVVAFPGDRVYFGDFGRQPAALIEDDQGRHRVRREAVDGGCHRHGGKAEGGQEVGRSRRRKPSRGSPVQSQPGSGGRPVKLEGDQVDRIRV